MNKNVKEMMVDMMNRIVIQPFGVVADIREDETVLQAIQNAGVQIEAVCNGHGTCGKCRIRIMEEDIAGFGGISSRRENVSDITDTEKKLLTSEEIEHGYRLACKTYVNKDIIIEIPRESRVGKQVIMEEGTERHVSYHPGVKAYVVEVEKPTLENHDDDFTRIKKELLKNNPEISNDLTISYDAMRQIGEAIRKGKWTVTVFVLYDNKVIKVSPGIATDYYGLAVDIGTTTIALYLCDLKEGRQIQSSSIMNPQIRYGDDVLTRVSYCMSKEDGLEKLQHVLFVEMNIAVKEMADKAGIERDDILETVLVFNTVMEHIALKINPESLGQSPFIPAITKPVDLRADDLGLMLYPGGNVHCLPIEAAFIGADNVAVLIAEEPYKQDKMKLIIDIGTNSEIFLGNSEKLFTTSCATGPALEGAQIHNGMRAAEGAIEKVVIDPVTYEPTIKIIGDVPVPIGICGSGIIDAVAQMAITGILAPNGKFAKGIVSDRIREDETGKMEYVLYFAQKQYEKNIVVKLKDIRAVQLAKAALYAGAKTLMKHCGIEQVDEVVLAGAFGSYIDKKNALALGMYPKCDLEHVTVSGNAAGVGAKLALLNVEKRKEAEEVARRVKFIETATEEDFSKLFAAAMKLKMDL